MEIEIRKLTNFWHGKLAAFLQGKSHAEYILDKCMPRITYLKLMIWMAQEGCCLICGDLIEKEDPGPAHIDSRGVHSPEFDMFQNAYLFGTSEPTKDSNPEDYLLMHLECANDFSDLFNQLAEKYSE